MNTLRQKAADFLAAYDMDCASIDFDPHLEIFAEQMGAGLAERESTLEMIPTYLEAGNEVPVNERVIVADAGGTNFRVATVYFDADKNPVIENLQKFTMPAVDCELSSKEFFEAMAVYFRGVLDASERVGFCFSYPADIEPSKDGRLIRFVKEIKAPEVVGHLIAKNLNETFETLGLGEKKAMVILNDTVATLLAGVDFKNRNFDSYIGFILGTGTNCAYVERNSNITKLPELNQDRSLIINVESGGMGCARRGQMDITLDESTNNPGVHKFEKMISGAYLGSVFLLTAKQACADGLVSEAAAEAINAMDDLTTKDMNDFMFYPTGNNPLANACQSGTDEDAKILYAIADRLVERAAKLTAINLSAMAIQTGRGTDPTRPICIVAEGTTFYHMKTLKSRVEFYLKQHLEDQHGIYTEIISVENATLIGAAIAGLTN